MQGEIHHVEQIGAANVRKMLTSGNRQHHVNLPYVNDVSMEVINHYSSNFWEICGICWNPRLLRRKKVVLNASVSTLRVKQQLHVL